MKWVYKWCFGQYHSVRTFNDMNGYSGDDFNYEDDEYNQLLSECLYEQNFEETGNPSNQTNSPYGFFQSLFEKSEQNSYHDNDNLSSNSDSSSSSSDSGGGGGD